MSSLEEFMREAEAEKAAAKNSSPKSSVEESPQRSVASSVVGSPRRSVENSPQRRNTSSDHSDDERSKTRPKEGREEGEVERMDIDDNIRSEKTKPEETWFPYGDDDYYWLEEKHLREDFPGYDKHEYPWSIFKGRDDLDCEGGKLDLSHWIKKFIQWRATRGKKYITEEYNKKALEASWKSFFREAKEGGMRAVNELIARAQSRVDHDTKHSFSGVKKQIHDLCISKNRACHVLLYEDVCSDCVGRDLSMECWRNRDISDIPEMSRLMRKYTNMLDARGIKWSENYRSNIRPRYQGYPGKELSAVPRNYIPQKSHATSRDNKSRGSSSKFDSHERECVRQSTSVAHVSRAEEEVEYAGTFPASYDFSDNEEERNNALQEYHPEVKMNRLRTSTNEKIEAFEKRLGMLESVVQAFATNAREASGKYSRLESSLRSQIDAIDRAGSAQNVRLQHLEMWKQEVERQQAVERRAAKRARGEDVNSPRLGAVQTLRRKEGLDAVHPSKP